MVRARRRPERWSSAGIAAIGALAASGLVLSTMLGASTPSAGASTAPAGAATDCLTLHTCYSPQQLEAAYGVAPLLARGIDGRGETVVLRPVCGS
jgi:subtilase family serine protease